MLTLSPARFDAAIFDLDGVLTDTARLHARAWKAVFDGFLRRYSAARGEAFRPFDLSADYLAYVDGRPREAGVRAFLAARGIALPESGAAGAAGSGRESVASLAARKDRRVKAALRRDSRSLPGAEALLAALRQAGIRVAVASSSANCALVLRVTGLERFVEARVDGVLAAELQLPGKPDPALFLEAARRLGVAPARAVLFEDALPGVEAGRRGGFGCVVGVAGVVGVNPGRGQAEALRAQGADCVIGGLSEVAVAG